MTCRDCIHYGRCHSEIAYGMGSDDFTGKYHTDIETRCKGFKNKADYVEVVRCKDCEKWDTSNRFLNTCACSRWSQSKSAPRLTKPDDFCSYGKRKEGAEQ